MSYTLNIAVCDDEPAILDELSKRIESFFNTEGTKASVFCFDSGETLLEDCRKMKYDVIFLDIKMPPPDGMETARRLRENCFGGRIIFVTSLEEYVFDAFEVSAYDYLIKPADEQKFTRTMKRLKNQLKASAIIVRQDGESLAANIDEIIYCEVIDRKLYLHMADGGVLESYGRLEDLEKQLDRRFFKCHRSYLINLAHIVGFDSSSAHMRSGAKVPVSRLRRKEFESALSDHLKGVI